LPHIAVVRPFLAIAVAALLSLTASSSRQAKAMVLTTLHDFTGDDGRLSFAALVPGSDGNFYGTAATGGANDNGTAFRVTPPPSHRRP